MKRILLPILPFLAVPLVGGVAPAQAPGAHWTMTPTPSDPPLRRENPGVSDGSYMYVFGGQSGTSGGAPMNDLWRFDGTAWTQMTADGAIGSPPQRDQAGITWDLVRSRLVVFGGQDSANNALGDTWEWDPNTNTWSNVTPAGTSPSARQWCALAFDWANGKVLMFGGLDASGHLNDTWHFDGTSWTQLAPAGPLPPVRRQHVLVERPDFGDAILCGGQEAGGAGMRSDTWKWDGVNWSQITTTTSPAGMVAIDAAYDQLRQRIVIAGGNPGPTGLISEFDSRTNEWVRRPLDPGIYKVTRYFLAYVPVLGKTYKVSGQALNAAAPAQNTYEFQTDFIATYSHSGTGCPGAAGVPLMTATGRPWLGETTSISVANVGPTEAVIVLVGLDNTMWRGNTLPMNAAPLGAPACTLYLAPLVFSFQGVGSTAAPLDITLNNNAALLGMPFYNQAVTLGSGPIGASMLGTGVIGIL